MRKLWFLALLLLLLNGCATYKFQKETSGENGYVVSRRGFVIPEFTVDENNVAPDLELAQERFNRRKTVVEQYYKKMGYIESRYKEIFWDPPAMMADFLKGFVTLPFIAISDYKYNHDPAYRDQVIQKEEKQEEQEENRIDGLRKQLAEYIKEDLTKENKKDPSVKKKEVKVLAQKDASLIQAGPIGDKPKTETSPTQEVVVEKEDLQEVQPVKEEASVVTQVKQEEPAVTKQEEVQESQDLSMPSESDERKEEIFPRQTEKKEVQAAPQQIKEENKYSPLAVITAKPLKGYSPLKVRFSASGSRSPYGRIVAYHWDFGDGETSNRKDPVNTYWSANYGSRYFTVKLTVTDNKGNTASSDIIIEVMNK